MSANDLPSLSPQGRGTARASAQGEGRAKNAGDVLALARAARRDMTQAEERLWSRLRDRRLGGCKFRRQHVLGRLRPDFVCIAAGLIVEVDGSQHVGQATRDAWRTRLLQHGGYRVLRVWNDDVLSRTDQVLEAILATLAAPHPGRFAACPSPAAREREE